ncbi:MAG TPA: hypothetical protein VGE74_06220 [Gemmata sp.]
MSVRRVFIAVALVCGLCVWGFARSGDQSVAAQTVEPVVRDPIEEDEEARDEAAARYRTNQSRHWRYVAVGNGSSH